jgi:hypothetical protein
LNKEANGYKDLCPSFELCSLLFSNWNLNTMDDYELRFRAVNHPRFSVVTCFNDPKILRANLLASLKHQHNRIFELIAIDNTNKKFHSIPSALNSGGEAATGEYIMFVHQDVYLCGGLWFDQALHFMHKLPNVGVAGVAGADSNGKHIGFILDRGRYWGNRLDSPFIVQTLDEHLMMIPNEVFRKLKFDELFDFHSYGADYCLSVLNLGLKSYVLPLMVEHNSLTTGPLGRKRDTVRKKIVSLYPIFLFLMSSAILTWWHFHFDNKGILDLGCSPFEQHQLKKHLSKKKFSIGISPNRRYLSVSKVLKVHDDYVIASPEKLPFKTQSFDVVFSSGLLEYLSKNSGEQVISKLEEIANVSIIQVPCSGSPIDFAHTVFTSNWDVNDFKKRHYKTFSIGFMFKNFPCILFASKKFVKTDIA